MTDQEENSEFARRINRETRANPDSPYAGKFLGIAHEQVVVVADSFDDADFQLDTLGFGRDDCQMIEASADYDTAIMFWSPFNLRVLEDEAHI